MVEADKKDTKEKEKELTEEELNKIAQGDQLYDGKADNALLDSIAKKGSNSVSKTDKC